MVKASYEDTVFGVWEGGGAGGAKSALPTGRDEECAGVGVGVRVAGVEAGLRLEVTKCL